MREVKRGWMVADAGESRRQLAGRLLFTVRVAEERWLWGASGLGEQGMGEARTEASAQEAAEAAVRARLEAELRELAPSP